jgi:hypothetical protein
VTRTAGALLAAALFVVCGAGAAPQWHQPVEVSAGDRALGPELAINPAGDSIAVWDQEVGADCATEPASLSCIHIIEEASRSRGSSAWQAPVEIARPGVGAAPQVAIDSAGDVAITWIHDIGRDRVLQASIRRGVSGVWPNPNDLSDPVLQIKNERIALDGAGNAVAVWSQRVATAFVVHAEVRPTAVGVWSSASRLSTPNGNASGGPALALAPGGGALVAWIEDGAVRVSSGDVPTGGWQPAVTLSPPSGSAEGDPGIAVDARGDAAVVWSWHNGGGDSVVQAAFLPAGGGWDPAIDVGPAATSAEPQVAIDDAGEAVALWRGDAAGTLRSAARAGGGTWSRAVDIVSSGATEPRLATSPGGNAVAAWADGDKGVIEAAVRPAASGEWQPAVDLSGPGSSGPRVAMNAGGGTVVVWNRLAGVRLVVEGSDLGGGGPLFSHMKVPRKAVAHVRIGFGVESVAWTSPLVGRPLWRFGDGGSATGAHVRHAYRRRGRYRVSVTQSDAAGGTSTMTATISVTAPRRRR